MELYHLSMWNKYQIRLIVMDLYPKTHANIG